MNIVEVVKLFCVYPHGSGAETDVQLHVQSVVRSRASPICMMTCVNVFMTRMCVYV